MRLFRFVQPLARPLAQRPGEFREARRGGVSLGPELAPVVGSGTGYTLSGSPAPTHDATGIHFVNASNLAAASKASAGLEDNATYRVTITIANFVNGIAQVMLYGPTSNHLGASANLTANGTYTFDLTTSATGSVLNTLRVRATGTSGNNNFDVTQFSVRKIL